jgi:hypothetical protein
MDQYSTALMEDPSIAEESVSRAQIVPLRILIATDPIVQSVGELLIIDLGENRVLLTAVVRFKRQLNFKEEDATVTRIEMKLKARYPAIQNFFLESGSLLARSLLDQ